jgi:hypothetical protein
LCKRFILGNSIATKREVGCYEKMLKEWVQDNNIAGAAYDLISRRRA